MQDADKDMILPGAVPQPPTTTTEPLPSPSTSQHEQPLSSSPEPSSASPATENHELTMSERLRDIQDATLRFFANASNETLGVCAVGLCASTYLVLGRVGLVLIGAVGGVVLHATWENSTHEGKEGAEGRAETARRRKELGLEVARRALDWRASQQRSDVGNEGQTKTVDKVLDYSDFQPATSKALVGFTDAVIRDYVKWWYSPILPAEDSFPAICRQTLASFIISFSNHLSRKRTADPFLDFIANSTSIMIVFLNELSSAVKASPNQTVEDAINTYLQYSPDSSLANVLSIQQQERKLNLVAEDILQNFLEKSTYSCGPARAFLREVLAGLILKATVDSCSKAEWINGWIVYMLEDGEPDIMNAIDASMENMGQGLKIDIGSDSQSVNRKPHQRRVSKAEEAMKEAMQEAHRINAMIAEDEARRRSGAASEAGDTASTAPDIGMATPSSSGSDNHRITSSMDSSMVFDSEGNAMPSGASSPAKYTSPSKDQSLKFTNFDQLSPRSIPTALQTTTTPPPPTEAMIAVPLTLHNASITILDMGMSNDKVLMKQKPNEEMLVQIESASSKFSGWMVTRRYTEFEPLHETLRRIAVISGIPDFSQRYANVPSWKGQNRASLVGDLETYLRSALRHERLAESEAMKKFLEKDTGLDKIPAANKNVILQGAAALDNVGKGFINVLGQGGKGIAGGGKAVLGGVQGVFGAVTTGVGGPKKPSISTRPSQSGMSRVPTNTSPLASARQSQDIARNSVDFNETRRPSLMSRRSGLSFEDNSRLSITSLTGQSQESLNLPPPPSEISDEFIPVSRQQTTRSKIETESPRPTSPMQASRPTTPSTPARPQLPPRPSQPGTPERVSAKPPTPAAVSNRITAKRDEPLTEEETRITVDLMFAIITSTYSLSSAWTIRLSLLSAAKTFLLRPNNPQLDSIRTLLQESLISANTSDAAIATHINKLRENSLPTEQELARWPKPLDDKEKEALRIKARKLLVERGMPQALTSVMGQAASGESLGKVFDCLQVEKVARGLMFAVMLQGIRAALQ